MLRQVRPDLDKRSQFGEFLQQIGQAGGQDRIFAFRKRLIRQGLTIFVQLTLNQPVAGSSPASPIKNGPVAAENVKSEEPWLHVENAGADMAR